MIARPTLFLLLLGLLSSAFARAQDAAEDAFARGNVAFSQEDYPAAIAAYEEALASGSSANLHYNLGTAYAHEEDWGRASLHLLKALALNPNDTDARAHLALVRKRCDLGWTERGAIERAATLFPLSTWAWMATVAFWLAVALWLLRPPGGSLSNLLGRLLLLGVVVVAGAAMTYYHLTGKRGVVLDPVALRVAPTQNSPRGTELVAGLQGDVQKTVNGFYLVRTEHGDEGYLSPQEFATVWED